MSLTHRLGELWPGVSQAWRYGSVRGLMAAIAFGVALNLAILSTAGLLGSFGLSESPLAVSAGAWIACGLLFIGSHLWLRQEAASPSSAVSPLEADQRLRAAQEHYLKRHWIEAETALAGLLRKTSDDVEARLLLASVFRRTGRKSDARRMLSDLLKETAAQAWRLEIERELTALAADRELLAQSTGEFDDHTQASTAA